MPPGAAETHLRRSSLRQNGFLRVQEQFASDEYRRSPDLDCDISVFLDVNSFFEESLLDVDFSPPRCRTTQTEI